MSEVIRVLIVDDEDPIRDVLKLTLETCQGFRFEVQCAASPNDAVKVVSPLRVFDVCIIDLRYDGEVHLAGQQIVFAVNCVFPNGITIVYSAHPQVPNVVRAMQLGATDFVSKIDCPLHELIDRIVNLLNERRVREQQRGILSAFILEKQSEWNDTKAGKVLAIVVGDGGATVAAEGESRLEALLNYEEERQRRREANWPDDPFLHAVPPAPGGTAE